MLRDEVDRHSEDRPPVLVAVCETFLISHPAWPRAEERANLPAKEEYDVVNWGKPSKPEGEYLQVAQSSQRAMLFDMLLDLEGHYQATEKEEFFEAEVRRVHSGVTPRLKVLLEGPGVLRGAHSERARAEHHDPEAAQYSHAIQHLEICVELFTGSRLRELSDRVSERHNPHVEVSTALDVLLLAPDVC